MSYPDEFKCFDIGMAGGCGFECPAFLSGQCDAVIEIDPKEIIEHFGFEDAIDIIESYNEYEEWLNDYRKNYPENFV